MCGMFFTTSKDENLIEILKTANKKRGGINESENEVEGGLLVHYQAPTSTLSRIHPAKEDESFLWHNGIIKETQIKQLQDKFNTKEAWDTQLLLKYLNESENNSLSDIDGSFALFEYDAVWKILSVCRNALVTLYTNEDYSIMSSAKIKGVCDILIESGVYYVYNKNLNKFVKTNQTFTTKNNPYDI